MPTSAKVIAHSVSHDNNELVSFEVELPRVILAEVNTYREGIARNYQSSRAVNLRKQRTLIRTDPFEPHEWLSNKTGMSGGDKLPPVKRYLATSIWGAHRGFSLLCHTLLDWVGLHKQWTNRLLEPHSHVKGIITVTGPTIEHILNQRLFTEDAQPEFKALAKAMFDAWHEHVPDALKDGQWHVPYRTRLWELGFAGKDLMIAAAVVCAQVSYRNFNPTVASVERIASTLITHGHMTPFEHIATPFDPTISPYGKSGTFHGYETIRALIEQKRWEDFEVKMA